MKIISALEGLRQQYQLEKAIYNEMDQVKRRAPRGREQRARAQQLGELFEQFAAALGPFIAGEYLNNREALDAINKPFKN
jgi:hypothetical protein